MLDALLGLIGELGGWVLDLVAFPTWAIPQESFPLTVFVYFWVIFLFWILLALVASSTSHELASALESGALPAITLGLRPAMTRRAVRSVFWLAGAVRRFGRVFGRVGYSADGDAADAEAYARPWPGARIAVIVLSVPYAIFRVLRGALSFVSSWYVLLCIAASVWAAIPDGWTIPAELIAGTTTAVNWFTSSLALVVAGIAVVALVIGFISAPARRGRLAWRSARVQRAHECLFEAAVCADAAAFQIERLLEGFAQQVRTTANRAANELTNGRCRWDERVGLMHLAERDRPWYRETARINTRHVTRDQQFRECRRALKRLARAVRRADDEHVFIDLWKLTAPPARTILLRLRRQSRTFASGSLADNPRRFPLQYELRVIEPELPSRKIGELREQPWRDDTQELAPGTRQWQHTEEQINELIRQFHRDYVAALWCLEELNALVRSLDRHVRPGLAGRAADAIAGK